MSKEYRVLFFYEVQARTNVVANSKDEAIEMVRHSLSEYGLERLDEIDEFNREYDAVTAEEII